MPLTAPLPFYSTFSSPSALASILLSPFLFLTNLLTLLYSFQLLHPFNLYFPSFCSDESSLLLYFQCLSISCQISLNKSQRGAVGPRNPGHGYPQSLSMVRASGPSMPFEKAIFSDSSARESTCFYICVVFTKLCLWYPSLLLPTPLALLLPL